MLPPGSDLKLSEIGLLSSTIETIDYSITEWLTDDLKLAATTNEGWKKVPVLWQSPERSFQIKNDEGHFQRAKLNSQILTLPSMVSIFPFVRNKRCKKA